MNLYLVHGTAHGGRTHFCGLPVRATGKTAAMRKVRALGLAPRGISQTTRMPNTHDWASEEFQGYARELTHVDA